MKTSKELRLKRAEEIEKMRAVLDRAESEGRDLSGEDRQELDRVETAIGELDQEIRAAELVASLEIETRKLVDERGDTVVRPGGKPVSLKEWREARATVRPQDDPEYRDAFFRLLTVRDPRELEPQELRVLSKATAGAGANLVPTDFARTLIDALRWIGPMRQLATVITTDSGDAMQVPTVSAHGTASWIAENGAYSPSDETFGQLTLNAYKAGTIILVSEELLADSAFDLDAYIRQEFATRIGILEETAYVAGDGSGKPTGVATSASAGVTAAAVAAITADELIDLAYSVSPPYRRQGAYLVSDAVEKAMRKLKDTAGQYLWQTSLQVGAPDVYNGHPVYTSPDLPTPATGNVPALFGDFSYYWIRDVNGITFQRLVELYAANGQVGFRAYHRTDGELTNTSAVKKLTMA